MYGIVSDSAPIHLAGSALGASRHVCAFFNSAEEGYRTLLPFIVDGFACGDRAFHIFRPGQEADHRHRLESAGVDVTAAQSSGQLVMFDSGETCVGPDGFDPHVMLSFIKSQLEAGDRQQFRLSRSIGHMDWAQDHPGIHEELFEYESRLNDVLSHRSDPVICVYDLAQFSGDVVVDVLRTHPMVILGGILRENPFFVPPEEFLARRRQQRAARDT